MAYDEGLAQRIREWLDERPGASEKRTFGGLCVLARGNMACGVVGEELMVRVGPDAYEAAIARPHAREMDSAGRALRGMVYVSTEGVEEDEALWSWLELGWGFASALPAKAPKVAKPARKRAAKAAVKKAAGEKTAAKTPAKKAARNVASKKSAKSAASKVAKKAAKRAAKKSARRSAKRASRAKRPARKP